MDKVVIRPCPRCESECKTMRMDILDMTVEYPMHYIGCTNPECLMIGPRRRNDAEAIVAWNEIP